MGDSAVILLVVAFVAFAVVAAMRAQRAFDAAVKKSFDALAFETPAGRVTGATMRIVKVVTLKSGSENPAPSDLFWYCAGPDSSYFVAIGEVRRRFAPATVKWVVRPLSEERMRAALAGDARAMELAFGHAIARTSGAHT